MRSLLLMRHAKSSWKQDGLTDFDRPLNDRGRRDAPVMAQRLAEFNLQPDLLICSTAVRAQETADLVIKSLSFTGPIRREERLYLAHPRTIISVVSQLETDVSRILLIAHNPGLEELTSALSGAPRHMPTAAIAFFELPIDDWDELPKLARAPLTDFWTPKDDV